MAWRHRLLAVLLGIGAISGFAWGAHSMHHHGPWRHGWDRGPHGRHADFEAHVADVCTRAAERVYRDRPIEPARTPP